MTPKKRLWSSRACGGVRAEQGLAQPPRDHPAALAPPLLNCLQPPCSLRASAL